MVLSWRLHVWEHIQECLIKRGWDWAMHDPLTVQCMQKDMIINFANHAGHSYLSSCNVWLITRAFPRVSPPLAPMWLLSILQFRYTQVVMRVTLYVLLNNDIMGMRPSWIMEAWEWDHADDSMGMRQSSHKVVSDTCTSESAVSGWLRWPFPEPLLLQVQSCSHQDCSWRHKVSSNWNRLTQQVTITTGTTYFKEISRRNVRLVYTQSLVCVPEPILCASNVASCTMVVEQ